MSVGKPRENAFDGAGEYVSHDADVPGAAPGTSDVREDIVGGAVAHDAGDHAGGGSETARQPDQSGAGYTATEVPVETHPGENTQDEPAMDMHETAVEDKVAGIEAQTRVDVGGEGVERIADVLRQRFTDAGIVMSDEDRVALAERIAAS